jgi:hypothetical protein
MRGEKHLHRALSLEVRFPLWATLSGRRFCCAPNAELFARITLMVALGTLVSSTWILAPNSWMDPTRLQDRRRQKVSRSTGLS